ncbi:hypothetical protein C1646_759723 [Rhizophagus diaphanus]|nr:hypothetical protein C1646_759723 [Rhizophagus diaphanus] [Rhizophagus sp. MUCL 43196]
MEYADSGSLRNYLKYKCSKLTWDDEQYDVGLALEIDQVLRETIIPDTPEDYVKIYTCKDGKPDNRPTIYQVVDWLKTITTKTDVKQKFFNRQVNKNLSNAEVPLTFKYFEKVADKNYAMEQLEVDYFYDNGIVKKDYNKAFELFKQSAEGNYSYEITMLTYCYSYSIGTKSDKQKAFAYLGTNMYEFGDGIMKDIDRATY